MRIFLAAAYLALATLNSAHGATLAGDNVTKNVFNGGAEIAAYNETISVGPGVDETDGNIGYDLDAGIGGDLFVISLNPGTYSSIYSFSGLTEVVLSDLDFNGGGTLSDLAVIDDGSLDAGYEVLSGSSFRVFWNEDYVSIASGEVFFSAQYVVEAAVPLPGSIVLLAAGLGLLHLRRGTA
ncbi:hypothetical protein [Mangrovicoccus sp. HB161399]|uniref:hypothetical protein n=1 Tax=Mangrovicoccus sp. HB161399 TaxID=2720392 RepID=UPI001556F71E|nr:hypothetical protein [Mangrovicoccus sp. HB161399]